MKVKFYGKVADELLKFAVIISKHDRRCLSGVPYEQASLDIDSLPDVPDDVV